MEKDFLNNIIFGKFQINKLIGTGTYSRVFSVRNLANQKIFAMKIQDQLSSFFGNLEDEAYNLYQLKGLGIPKLITYGHYRKYKYGRKNKEKRCYFSWHTNDRSN